jgi:hypothetical protein
MPGVVNKQVAKAASPAKIGHIPPKFQAGYLGAGWADGSAVAMRARWQEYTDAWARADVLRCADGHPSGEGHAEGDADQDGPARRGGDCLFHLSWFRPVHCKSVSAQEVQALLGARKAVQQGMIVLELLLRGLLRNFGLKVGAISRGRFGLRVRELACGSAMLEAAMDFMLRSRASLRQELAGLERRVRLLAEDDPVCCRLMAMPGVGAVVALTFRSAIDDPTRFSSSKTAGPWAGPTPSRHQSGERDVTGGITRAGDADLRRALCQTATVMMNRGRASWLRSWAAQVAKRLGRMVEWSPWLGALVPSCTVCGALWRKACGAPLVG